MMAQSGSNPRTRQASSEHNIWAKPHSVLENLQGSVEKLSLTLNAVREISTLCIANNEATTQQLCDVF
jgi:hypothetical protein